MGEIVCGSVKGFYVFMGVMCMPNPKTYEQTLQLLFSCM